MAGRSHCEAGGRVYRYRDSRGREDVLMIITIILPTMSLNKTSSHGTFYYKNYKNLIFNECNLNK